MNGDNESKKRTCRGKLVNKEVQRTSEEEVRAVMK